MSIWTFTERAICEAFRPAAQLFEDWLVHVQSKAAIPFNNILKFIIFWYIFYFPF